MKEQNIHIQYHRASSSEELDSNDKQLIDQAIAAMHNAYAPYSKFHVGCAVQLENGEIVTGNNQENIAYPSGLCAERVALFAASSQYPGVRMNTIAIVTSTPGTQVGSTISPCGSCRQVMMEYERKQQSGLRVLMGAAEGPIDVFENAAGLLPLAFFDAGLSED